MNSISCRFISAGECPSICLCGILLVPIWWYLKYLTEFSISSSSFVSFDTLNDLLIVPLRCRMSTFFPTLSFDFIVAIFKLCHGCPRFLPRVLNVSSAESSCTLLIFLSNGRKSANPSSNDFITH